MSIFSRLQGFFLKNNIILGNIFSLGALQIFNYIIPLITLPYILRVLGPDKYGIVVFYGAFVSYFLILINYGFNFSATKNISVYRNDLKKISEIFWSVFFIKVFFGILSIAILFLLTYIFPRLAEEYLILIFSFLAIFGEILFPIWLFQGLERMKYITLIQVIVKIFFLIPIFIFIKSTNDYIYLPLITSISSIVSGGIAFIIAIKIIKISLFIPNLKSFRSTLLDGWHIFISTLFISLYTSSTIFVLGIFASSTVVGFYASAEKLVRAIQGLIGPVAQAIYPTISKKLVVSREKTIVFLKKLTILVFVIMFFVSLFLFFGAEFLVKIIFGTHFDGSITILKILSFLPLIVGLNTIYSNLVMLNFGFQRAYSVIYVSVSIFSIFLSLGLIYQYESVGLAFSVLITESLLLILVNIFLLRKGINLI